MESAEPTLELTMAEADDALLQGINAPLSLRLMPGECAVVESMDVAQVTLFADLCSGLLPVRSGSVTFLGRDWADLSPDYAAALRGHIGRVFTEGAWVPFLDAETNILLPQLYHTRRDRDALRAEATRLAQQFGLPGAPQGWAVDLSPGDRTRGMLVRAFLGDPPLVLVEEPPEGLFAEFGPALLNQIAIVRDRGGVVLWLTCRHIIQTATTFAASHHWRLTTDGLVEMRPAA